MSEYRKGYVYIQNHYAGIIEETEDGYAFSYTSEYLQRPDAVAASITLTLRVVSHNWKINANDRFGLLLLSCKDCIGDVCIRNEVMIE